VSPLAAGLLEVHPRLLAVGFVRGTEQAARIAGRCRTRAPSHSHSLRRPSGCHSLACAGAQTQGWRVLACVLSPTSERSCVPRRPSFRSSEACGDAQRVSFSPIPELISGWHAARESPAMLWPGDSTPLREAQQPIRSVVSSQADAHLPEQRPPTGAGEVRVYLFFNTHVTDH
jgi:hypothetical protein